MKRIAVDIETMATTPTAAVIAVGIVIQNDLDPESRVTEIWQIDPNLAVGDRDANTLKWWSDQQQIVRMVAFGGKLTPREACLSINTWLHQKLEIQDTGDMVESRRYYANPARFDFAILENMFIRCGVPPFIDWQDERCQRSIEKELIDLGVEIPTFPNHFAHDPVSDCLHQLDELNWMLGYLEGIVRYDQQGRQAHLERPGL